MTVNQLTRFQDTLESALERTEQKSKQLKAEILQMAGDQTSIVQNGFDHAQTEVELNTMKELSVLEARRGSALRSALERIRSGTYGFCCCCREAIDIRRLEAYPAAANCINCQEGEGRGEPMPASSLDGVPFFKMGWWGEVSA